MNIKINLSSMLSIMMVAMLSVGLASCKEDPELNVDGTMEVSLEANGKSVDAGVTVKTKNTGWSITVEESWLHAQKSGNGIKVSAEENTDPTERKGTITITADEDGSLKRELHVTQAGAGLFITVGGVNSLSLSPFPGTFGSGKEGVDYKQTLTAESNVSWSITSIPDWLSVSPTNGNGSIVMSIYPKTENPAATERSATITLTGGGQTATIAVRQEAGVPDIKVLPTNITALYNQIAWEFTALGNVDKYRMICVSEAVLNRKTDKELLADINTVDTDKLSDGSLFFYDEDSYGNEIRQSTSYYICTVAYNDQDIAGELIKTKITTPAFIDYNNDAFVTFSDGVYNTSSFQFTVTKEGFCNTYHLVYGNVPSSFANYNKVLYAFQINYFVNNRKKHWLAENYDLQVVTNYPNNHTFTHYTSTLATRPYVIAYGQGVFADGSVSSDMTGIAGDTSSSSREFSLARQSHATRGNMVLKRHSDVAEEVRNLK